jgi:hypothetical protein
MTNRIDVAKLALAGLPLLWIAAPQAARAQTTPLSLQLACASDYYAYCSRHDPDGPQTRTCMRANGPRLSQRCIDALIAAGRISRREVARRAASGR